jgi:transcriptional regulator with XRE-family HTH domain
MIKKQTISSDEKKYLKKVGARLKHFREKAGFTSYEYFAYENNINRSQYGSYEAGANIQLDTLIRLLKALKVTLKEFFSKGFD